MKKIYNLNLKLEEVETQKNKFVCSENTTIQEFIQYKHLLNKEKRLNKALHKLYLLQKEVNFLYDINTKSWIANPKINCRKYYKLDQYALYHKDLTLYKIGVLVQKPTHPIIKNIQTKLKPYYNEFHEFLHSISNIPFISKTTKNFNTFFSNKLPNCFNNLSIRTAKICIKIHSKLKKECLLTQNSLSSKKIFRYISKTIKEANKQIAYSNPSTIHSKSLVSPPQYVLENSNRKFEKHYSISEKSKAFKESLKVPKENLVIPQKRAFSSVVNKYEKNLSI